MALFDRNACYRCDKGLDSLVGRSLDVLCDCPDNGAVVMGAGDIVGLAVGGIVHARVDLQVQDDELLLFTLPGVDSNDARQFQILDKDDIVLVEADGARDSAGELSLSVIGTGASDLDSSGGSVQEGTGFVDPDGDLGCVALGDDNTGN